MKAVLLDVDGTLVDSNEAHTDAWMGAFREEGLLVDRNVVRRSIGMGGDKLIPKVAGLDAESDQGQRLTKLRGEIFARDFLPKLKAFEGSLELLKQFKSRGLKLVVASSASKKDGHAILAKFDLDDYVDVVTCSADAENSKPDPDIILAALKKAHLNADKAVMLGDTPYDVTAASRANVAVVGFTCGGWRKDDLKAAKRVYEGPAALLADLESFLQLK